METRSSMASMESSDKEQHSNPVAEKAINTSLPPVSDAANMAIEKPAAMPDFPDGGARAWLDAIGAAGVIFCTLGYVNAFGVLQEYYAQNQLSDQSASNISWIGGLQFFFLYAGTLVGGPMFDRYGSIVMYPGALLYVFSLMMTSLCTEFYQFILAQGVLGGISIGLTMTPAMASIGQYFMKKRAAALGIAVAGSSIGGVVFPIMLGQMLPNPRLGLPWTMRISGFIVLVVIIPSCMLIRARLPPRKGKFLLLGAFKEATFSVLVAGTFLTTMCIFVPLFYLPNYAIAHGMSPDLASYLISIHNAASLFGRVGPGLLADRVGRLNVFFTATFFSAIIAFCWQSATSNAGIIVFAAFYGFCSGAIVSMTASCFTLAAKRPSDIGTYLGMGMAAVAAAPLVGPPISGAILSSSGSYGAVADFAGAVLAAGAVLIAAAKWTHRKGMLALI